MTQYTVTVKPGSSQEKIVEVGKNEYIVYLRAKPHDGEANTALLKVLSKHFDVPKTSITIVRGTKSRIKQIQISD